MSRLNTPRIPRNILISVMAIFLFVLTSIAQHSPLSVRAGLIRALFTFELSLRGIFSAYKNPRLVPASQPMQLAHEGPHFFQLFHVDLSLMIGTWHGLHSPWLLRSALVARHSPLLTDIMFCHTNLETIVLRRRSQSTRTYVLIDIISIAFNDIYYTTGLHAVYTLSRWPRWGQHVVVIAPLAHAYCTHFLWWARISTINATIIFVVIMTMQILHAHHKIMCCMNLFVMSNAYTDHK